MSKSHALHLVCGLLLCLPSGARAVEQPAAVPAGVFTNPILPGFHPDPSICRVGDDYYLVCSTFEYFPGVPIFQSRDLVHWKQIGNVLSRKSQLNLEQMYSSGGIFAPTLRWHDGKFYMITTLVGAAGGRGGNFYVTATNAAGPWSDPVWVDRAGIDPSLFFDGDGQVYYTRQVDGERGYSGQQLLNLQTGKLEGELKQLWRGTGGIWPEGPHLYKVAGKYYLMISEGGTSYDHAITIARSDSPWGPFEPNPANPILTHRHLPTHPFQGVGHGDLVETPDGWWVIFLGYRPQGGRFHHLGRETFLAPVTWENGWPVINGGKPIPATLPAPKLTPHPWPAEPAREEFASARLGPGWMHVRNPVVENYSLTARSGWLRLRGSAVTLNDQDTPTFVGRRQTDLNCVASAKLDFVPRQAGEEAGLALRGNEKNHFDIVVTWRDGRRVIGLRKILAGRESEPVAFREIPAGEVILTVKAVPLRYEFFVTVGDGREISLGSARTRDLSTETLTGQKDAPFNFTGAVFGLFATGSGKTSSVPADFDWFEYSATAASAAASPAVEAAPAQNQTGLPAIRIKTGVTEGFTDPDGRAWLPDQGFADGDTIDRPDLVITNTANPRLYQTERYGMTKFTRTLPNGRYVVKLHFCEAYEGIGGPGERVFSFNVAGREFKDFDVWQKAGGPLRAYVETVSVEVSNGKLEITFTPKVENPQLNALEILPDL